MRRGELYRTEPPAGGDPRRRRVYLVVSRQQLLDSAYSTVLCVPVFSSRDGLRTQVDVGPEHGLRQPSALHCDNVVSVRRELLRNYVGSLPPSKMREVNRALAVALDLDDM